MKCPFRIRQADFIDTISVNGRARDAKITAKTFEDCHGEDCPYYYVDENDVSKCARCVGQEEEIL